MNKKGITLVEIVISVGLISLVMIFLFNLLIDMQYEEANSEFSKDNQLNRATMIQTIESDFMAYNLSGVVVDTQEDHSMIHLSFLDAASPSKWIRVYPDSFNYNGEEAWTMDDENAHYDFQNIRFTIFSKDYAGIDKNLICSDVVNPNTGATEQICSNFRYIKITIPVVSNEKENSLDDIELFYVSRAT